MAIQHVHNGKDVFVWLPTAYPSLSVNATRNIGPKWPRRLACFASTVNELVACFASSNERQKWCLGTRLGKYKNSSRIQTASVIFFCIHESLGTGFSELLTQKQTLDLQNGEVKVNVLGWRRSYFLLKININIWPSFSGNKSDWIFIIGWKITTDDVCKNVCCNGQC